MEKVQTGNKMYEEDVFCRTSSFPTFLASPSLPAGNLRTPVLMYDRAADIKHNASL